MTHLGLGVVGDVVNVGASGRVDVRAVQTAVLGLSCPCLSLPVLGYDLDLPFSSVRTRARGWDFLFWYGFSFSGNAMQQHKSGGRQVAVTPIAHRKKHGCDTIQWEYGRTCFTLVVCHPFCFVRGLSEPGGERIHWYLVHFWFWAFGEGSRECYAELRRG